jgi:hypothetical protein
MSVNNPTERYHNLEDSNPQFPSFAVNETLEWCELRLTEAGPRLILVITAKSVLIVVTGCLLDLGSSCCKPFVKVEMFQRQ